jgi:WD40 repeat protein
LERENSTTASAIQSQFDEWRRDTRSADEMTARYFTARHEFYITHAKYQHETTAYQAGLKNKYRSARWFPFAAAAPDSPPPTYPLQPAPLYREPGKTSEIITEGGVSAAFSPSGTGLAMGCRDRAIRLLELPSRRVLASLALSDAEPHTLEFSPDGTTLYAVGEGRLIWRWEVATGRAGRPIPWIGQSLGQSVPLDFASAARCSPDGETIAVAANGLLAIPSTVGTSLRSKYPSEVYAVRLLDTRTGALKWQHKGTGCPPHSLAFSPDGETLAFGSGRVALLDTRTGILKNTLKPVVGYAIAVAFSRDGRTLAGAGADTVAPGVGAGGSGRVTLWDVSSGRTSRTLEGPTEAAFEVAFSHDGQRVAAGGRGPGTPSRNRYPGRRTSEKASEVRLWDVTTGKLIWTTFGESNSAFSLSFSPDGKAVVFCDEDYVYLIDAGTGRLKQIVMETVTKFRSRNRAPAKNAAVPEGL